MTVELIDKRERWNHAVSGVNVSSQNPNPARIELRPDLTVSTLDVNSITKIRRTANEPRSLVEQDRRLVARRGSDHAFRVRFNQQVMQRQGTQHRALAVLLPNQNQRLGTAIEVIREHYALKLLQLELLAVLQR
jgi:hypothetical protein